MAKDIKAAAPVDDDEPVRLTVEDLERIKLKAKATVQARRKKELEAAALKAAIAEIEGDAAMLTGDPHEDEIVNFTVRLAVEPWIRINGMQYEHGRTYPVMRHVARSLQEICWRTEQNEHGITDKPLSAFFAKPRHTAISRKGVVNAPSRPDA